MRLEAAGRLADALAPALPQPYVALRNAGLHFQRGQLSLTVAGPGVGKSALWMNLAYRMGVPCVYWSGDTAAHDILLRTTALTCNVTMTEAGTNTGQTWETWRDEHLPTANHIEWVFDSTITAANVGQRMKAFAEVHGEYPELFVTDNLSNVVDSEAEEMQQQKAFLKEMQDLARESGSHIAILAHAKGAYDDGNRPIPLSGVYNNLGKIPEIVLTLNRGDEEGNVLVANVVKNRGGLAHASANKGYRMDVDYSRALVRGYR